MQGSGSSAILTDEQIIGLDPTPADGAASVAQVLPEAAVGAGEAEAFLLDTAGQNPQVSRAFSDRQPAVAGQPGEPELQPATSSDQGQIPTPQADPAWLRTLEAQPQGGREAAAEARSWRAAATDVAALDAAYFSASPDARAGLATRLYDSDPTAFRAMLAESARVIAQRDPQALAELARQLGAQPAAVPPAAAATPSLRAAAARDANEPFPLDAANQNPRVPRHNAAGETELQMHEPMAGRAAFPADAYRSFEAATNEDVARRVHQAIDHTLSTTLPEGTAEGARRRIAADIFQEVQASLSADRDLTRRVGETLRDWRFDAAARQQIASLLSGRARAVLPEVARRVVTEWTSSVLATDRARTARLDAATSRREVSGGRLPEQVPAGALRPRDVDYRRMSDDQILDM